MRANREWLSIGLAFCILFVAAAGCTRDEVKSNTTDKAESRAFDQPETTYLGRATGSIAADHRGESGFLLMDRGRDALAWRMILADAAEQSIDAQYFLWKDDAAGKVMMQRLLAAADRGVRVRVLIDDSMTESVPQYLALFGAHPKVELRLYKPFGPKHKSLGMRWVDYVPANLYPVMYVGKLDQSDGDTILSGVQAMYAAGWWAIGTLTRARFERATPSFGGCSENPVTYRCYFAIRKTWFGPVVP